MTTLAVLAGRRADHAESLATAAGMLVVMAGYQWLSAQLVPDVKFNTAEFIGTWSGLVCVWLCRTRNILCWPWGIVSSLTLGLFFMQIALPGQQWLHWAYFVPLQVWAWPHWAFGGDKGTELPVTTMSWTGRAAALAAIAAGTLAVHAAIGAFAPGSLHPLLDAVVVASSVVAQFLLGRKKVESWLLWLGPVNALSIALFFMAGAYTLMALYVAFFVHALFAIQSWRQSCRANLAAA